jgi:uncharacterized membrane protein
MEDRLTPSRKEAFSDGVIAVIITIMVLEIHVPARGISDLEGLRQIAPILVVYLLSFVQVGIYWVNHHYLVDDLEQVTASSGPTLRFSSASHSSPRPQRGSASAG